MTPTILITVMPPTLVHLVANAVKVIYGDSKIADIMAIVSCNLNDIDPGDAANATGPDAFSADTINASNAVAYDNVNCD